jgi:hypothetical protein
MDDVNIKKKITLFIKRRIGFEVNDNTTLFGELELIGLDADTFVDAFSKEFNVDFKGLKFDDYFVDVSNLPFYYWYLKAFKKERLIRKGFKLNHLVKVVKAGKWIEP